jgi:hypothetical protein
VRQYNRVPAKEKTENPERIAARLNAASPDFFGISQLLEILDRNPFGFFKQTQCPVNLFPLFTVKSAKEILDRAFPRNRTIVIDYSAN